MIKYMYYQIWSLVQVLPNLVIGDLLPHGRHKEGRSMAVRVKEKRHFNLGMEDWTEAEKENAPSRKRLKLSLSKSKPQEASSRWEFLNIAQQEALAVKHVPKNTSASTNWAVTNFCEWRRN